MSVLRLRRKEFSKIQAEQLWSLWAKVWPKEVEVPVAEKAEAFLWNVAAEHRMEAESELFHIIEESGVIVAAALSYVREIRFVEEERSVRVLALAGVSSSPEFRGRGFGKEVVADAFARLGPELLCSLYQTGVPEFYEKLGAFRVDNEFVNSLADDPEARPWWDEFVMVYGRSENWTEGRVDLCGVAY